MLMCTQLLRREVLVWRQLKHPRILTLIGVEKAGGPQSLSIVSVRLESESLQSFVDDRRRRNTLPIGHTECVGLVSQHVHACIGQSYQHETCSR
jgi:serine/threonine protein kinase